MFVPPNDTFEVSPWQIQVPERPKWADDEQKKKLYGIELTKNNNPLEAAKVIFWNEQDAMWAANNWLHDPVVLASKKAILEQADENLLDKDALSRKLLKFSEEKDRTGQFYVAEAKDRLAALRLYAEIQGYIGKVDINASTNNYVNGMTIKFVSPEKRNNDEKVIDVIKERENEIETLPLNIKLVSAK